VEMNTRLIAQAQKQLADTKSRLTKVRREHKMILVAIDEANQTGRTEADRESKKIVADAKKIAAQVVAHAETDAMARVAAAEHRVIELDVERNTIAEYVSSLRAIVGKVVATEEKASQKAVPATKRATSQAMGSKKDSAAS
jgi:regulator of protease activity HflC (stomatin/prohibitin superfamily)